MEKKEDLMFDVTDIVRRAKPRASPATAPTTATAPWPAAK